MPRRKRDHLKRAIANAISYTQDASSWVILLQQQFEGIHEDYAAYLSLILRTQAQAGAMLMDFWKKALGTDEVNWESYTTIKAAFEPKQLTAVANRTTHGKGRLKKKDTEYFDLPEKEQENGDHYTDERDSSEALRGLRY